MSSYLPYAQSGLASWLAATGSSAVVHAGVVALALGGLQQLFEPTEAAQPQTEYTITLEQLDADTLAGLVERLGTAGAEGEELPGLDEVEPDALNPEAPEELAALAPEDTLRAAEAAEPPEQIEPEALAPEPEPETIEALPEPETIDGDTELETLEALPEPETLEPLPEPETLEPLPEPETLAALPEPETLQAETEPDVLETVETPEALTAEDITALEPVTTAIAEPQPLSPVVLDTGPAVPETVTSVAPSQVGVTAAAVAPVSAAPVVTAAPQPQSVAAVAPSASAATRVAPSAAAPQAVQPSRAEPQTIAAARPPVPDAPETSRPAAQRPPAPPPSAQDIALGDLIRRIRTSVADACLLALPRRDGEDGVGLAFISSTDAAMERFSQDVLTEDDADIRQTRTLVDPRQCPAVTYIRQNRDYPATRLGVQLDATEVPSGGRLTGVLRGTAGKYVLLLLVDNNGVVQDLQRFMSFSGNFARFDVPVTRAGAARDTSQLLLAIATNRPPSIIRDRAGRLAQDVFAGLDGDFADSAALAIVAFDVR